MKPRIKLLLSNVHMGLGHEGLWKLIKKEVKLDVRELETGDLVMCMNRQGNRLKVIGGRGLVVGYLKMPGNQRIMTEALQYIPETFGGEGFSYDKACRKALEKRFEMVRIRKAINPLQEARMMQ